MALAITEAKTILSTSPVSAADRVLVAAVRLRRAEQNLSIASSTWYAAKGAGADDEPQLYEELKLSEAVRDGWLAELQLATRNFEKVSEID